ncbi:MAG: TIGR02584 family CRISPR-associated protein [Nitrospirae bacterium]|nr:MAG: TIGR02584 family CRISPR-associated protein [Nitrospirota bacterium]
MTGLTPQVVTETLYCLAVAQEPPWIPTEVHLVTTAEGAERAEQALLSEAEGWFHRLRRDYRLPPIRFDVGTIHVIAAPDDLADPLANGAAADAITERVRRLTADPESALHVSIAGGRKSLAFFAGHALSLFGRPQDRLSHVLVEGAYQGHPGFFYPPPRSCPIHTGGLRPLDAAEARVVLAEIPFVRLRQGLPEALLAGRASYSAAVAAAQPAPPLELRFELASLRVVAGGRGLELPPADLAFYLWFAWRRLDGLAPIRCPADGAPEEDYARAFLLAYERLRGPFADIERTRRALAGGMSREYFLQRRSKLHRRLRTALGAAAAEPYLVQAQGSRPDTLYGLTLPASAIRFPGLEEGGR